MAALGGLLFGYDSAVINGAVDSIQEDFGIGNAELGFAVASALLGAAAGAMSAGRIADKIGRISVMKIAALFFLVSAFGTAMAPNVEIVVLFRIVGGIGVGIASVIAPAYIAETSPPSIRGRLGSLQQLAIVSGIFLSFAVNWLLQKAAGGPNEVLWLGMDAWRWMFLVMAVPALVYGGLAFTIPESPRYLVASHKIPEARKVLSTLLGQKNLEITINRIRETLEREDKPSWKDLKAPTGGIYGIVWVGLGLSVFQQFVGINVIFYYSNVLWQAVGFSADDAAIATVITSVINVATTLIAIALIDKIGRKPLLLIGSSGMAVTLITMSVIFANATLGADGKPSLPGALRHDRADRREPVRRGLRHVVGPGGLGASRRDVPEPHQSGGARFGRGRTVGGELVDHRDVPRAARPPRPGLRVLRAVRRPVGLVRVEVGHGDQGRVPGGHARRDPRHPETHGERLTPTRAAAL